MTELLAARIARRVAAHPEAAAVVSRHGEIGYREFWGRVTRAAAGLLGMNRVAVLPTSDIDSLVAVVAAMRAGVSVVLLHRHLPPDQLARMLRITAPGVVIAQARQHPRLRRMGLEGPIHTAADLESEGRFGVAQPGGELLVGITSGTTGEPKLFVRNQKSWAATLDRSDATFGIGVGDRVAVPGVLDHTHFLYGALHALTRGATVDLRSVEISLNGGATHLYSVPTLAWDAVRSVPGPIGSVREVLSSAARWPRSGREALRALLPNASLVHFYGASELSFVSFDRGLGSELENSAGQLFAGVEAQVRDGLVFVRSDMLFDGYLTAAGVVGGPVDGWMSVGDRGLVRGNELQLFGRAGDMLIRAGFNVDLTAVETALAAIPGVAEAACVAVPDARMGEVPAAAIVASADAPTVPEIRRLLRGTLPGPSMPVRILSLDSLPRTPRGKLDRPALTAALSGNEGGHR
ncbi:AMP-binding protein [Nocardia sp. NEAU-G5]|uniref:AMP-binding protein n=1 Tax=Nocardia albiluteola TaxID=2842303 RepID=A0ABS6BBH6_9NOCA|nr:AMP-binding protein [Nocardia albiluteola]MBU3067639.1 AMP-binding protein [Nocardia albiluteola]